MQCVLDNAGVLCVCFCCCCWFLVVVCVVHFYYFAWKEGVILLQCGPSLGLNDIYVCKIVIISVLIYVCITKILIVGNCSCRSYRCLSRQMCFQPNWTVWWF